MMKRIGLVFLLAGCLGLTGCESPSPDAKAVKGVLHQLPGNPKADDPQMQADEAAYQEGLAMRGTDRAKEAAEHAGITKLKHLEAVYSPVLGRDISEQETPAIHKLLKRAFTVSREISHDAKREYRRDRPFVVHPEDMTCRPDLREGSNPHYSYPSGHTVAAWSVATMLARIFPEKADDVLALGNRLGESRWICGYHWKSDVEGSKLLVERVVDRLMEDKSFQKQFKKAKLEAVGM